MIRITSLVLLATSLVAFSSPLLPRTAAEIESDIEKLITDTTALDTSINNLTTAGIVGVGPLEEDTTTLLNDLKTAVTDTTGTGQLDGTDGTTILGLVEELEPIILKTLEDLVSNEPLIEVFDKELKGITAFVQEELANLASSTEQFETALIEIAPASLKPTASAIASTINAGFSTAIAAYATAT
ncbi:hypothetical protein Clacol_009188 [Clathrus columnatus]|uniref:Uncharacterized protein n=1 Tax=Clathrus columnatus TaxID=1419009 RepID=A0AAV5APE5_9AGAM|nr:hypothetical protein Clacol_009188 [Clathrus columnatus]